MERHGFHAEHLAEVIARETGTLALVYRDAAAQVGQGERRLAVTPVGGAEQREQRRVLGDRQDLPVAGRPPPRGKAKAKQLDLTQKWFHDEFPSGFGGSRAPGGTHW